MMIVDSSDITVGPDGERIINHYKMISHSIVPNGEEWPMECNLMPITHRPQSGTATTYHVCLISPRLGAEEGDGLSGQAPFQDEDFSVPKNDEGESKI